MIDWTKSMKQTFEYYVVDPNTWKDTKKIDNITKSSIDRDSDSDTLGSATFDSTDSLGECYIRTYLIAIQNGLTEKVPLGTHLIQTPSTEFDGRVKKVSMDAYTTLLELKENPPPVGYSITKGTNIMDTAYRIVRENVRCPVVKTTSDKTLDDDFVANLDDNWLVFTKDLIANDKRSFDIDEMGRILFSPDQETASLQPVWTYDDSNSSILYAEITHEHDIYGIPNVVEVIYSKGSGYFYSRVVNDDANSPTSTINRGREIVQRVSNPEITGNPTQSQLDEYARTLLKQLSSVEYTLSYSHGYCPVRVGDCVRINYERAGLVDIKVKVISQSISCEAGCKVTEKAVYTAKLWR